jgi:hypothetical protein
MLHDGNIMESQGPGYCHVYKVVDSRRSNRNLVLNISHPRNPRKLQTAKLGDFLDLCYRQHTSPSPSTKEKKKRQEQTHTFPHLLHILPPNPNPPHASQMPPRLPRQILHHNPGEDDELRFDGVEDAVVGEVQAVGDFEGEPGWDIVRMPSDCYGDLEG